ncbi:MAG: radical SAM protein [Pseudobdellovibrionaceae bacterium]
MKPKVILLADLRYQLHVRYLGPYALASELNARGIPTMVLNWHTSKEDLFEYLEPFLSEDCVAVGISSTFLFPKDSKRPQKNYRLRSLGMQQYVSSHLHFSESEDLLEWSGKLKQLMRRKAPNAKLVMGGAKTYLLKPDYFAHAESPYRDFDYFFLGASNNSFPKFIEDLLQGQPPEIDNRNGFKFVRSSPHDNYPAKVTWHPNMAIGRGEALPFEVARGCAFSCKFCNFEKLKSQFKNKEQIKKELLHNYETFGTQHYLFVDDCVNDSNDKVIQICSAIDELPFEVFWTSYARIDPIVRSPDLFDRMFRSGCRGVHFGIESFNAAAARLAGKPVPPDKVKDTLLALKSKYGSNLQIEASFITGLPRETVESQVATIDWIKKNPVFDFFSVSALAILEYDAMVDGTVVHFAEHSKNPQKYGFKKIEYNPHYWEHETMDFHKAEDLAAYFIDEVTRNKPRSSNIWQYPMIRSLGYTHQDFIDFNEGNRPDELNFHTLNVRYKELQNRHWKDLNAEWLGQENLNLERVIELRGF